MATEIKVKCKYCNKLFCKKVGEYNRQIKKGRDYFFCGRPCSIRHNHNIGAYNYTESNKNLNQGYNLTDEFTPFRWFINRAKYRARKSSRKECNIDTKFLKALFEKQQGLCPITGWQLQLPKNTRDGFIEKSIKNASLDRIDNNQGYVENNIRFISVMANIAKGDYSDKDLFQFCEAVTNKIEKQNE